MTASNPGLRLGARRRGRGALAEYTVADGHMMAPKPRNLTVREGAALRRDHRVFPPDAPCVSLQSEGPVAGD